MKQEELKSLIRNKLKEILKEELGRNETNEGGDQMQQIAALTQGIRNLTQYELSPEVNRLADDLLVAINNSLKSKAEDAQAAAQEASQAVSA